MHDDAAPGVARRQRAGDLALAVELERVGDFGPGPVEHGGGLRTDQLGEVVDAEGEAGGRIHLPDEAERKLGAVELSAAPRGSARLRGGDGCRGIAGARDCMAST